MSVDVKTVELGRRLQTGRRKMRAICRKFGMDWHDFLGLVKRFGLPGEENQAEWIAKVKPVAGKPRAFDWAAFLAAIMPIVQQFMAMCIVA